jgi:hypothetical protein
MMGDHQPQEEFVGLLGRGLVQEVELLGVAIPGISPGPVRRSERRVTGISGSVGGNP